MQPIGLPLNCHPVLRSGERASAWPAQAVSRSGRQALRRRGRHLGRAELPRRMPSPGRGPASGIPRLSRAFRQALFRLCPEWYETVGIGVSGGDIDAIVEGISVIRSSGSSSIPGTSSTSTSG